MVSQGKHDRQNSLSWFRIQPGSNPLPSWRRVFLEQGQKAFFARGSVLMRQADSIENVYYILRGFTEYTYLDASGEGHLIDIMSFGNILGLQAVYSEDNVVLGDLTALTDVEVLSMKVGEVARISHSDSKLGRELLEEMSRIAGGLAMQSYSQSVPANDRICVNLYLMGDVIAREMRSERLAPPDCGIEIDVSQEDLARISHTTRVTAAKVLRHLRDIGLVDTQYRKFVITNLDGLREYLEHKRML